MMTFEQRFRRNLIAVAIGHGAFIFGLVIFDWIMPAVQKSFAHEVELVVPADLLGDLPKGPGVGRGAYAPAPPPAADAGGSRASLAPAASTVAPAAAPVARASRTTSAPVAKLQAGEVAAPKKSSKSTKATAKKTAPTSATAGKSGTSKSTGSKTGTGTGTASTASIRNRFANALGAQPGGTPYGDGRPGGGGSGRSSVIGSPDGAPDGVVGGVGKGTPFWWYYEQVHDRLYEAWDQPGEAVKWDKNLVSTLVLTVARDGRIVDVGLKVTSGNRVMDESALTAARSVARLQPLPDGLGDATAKITVNFRLEG